MKWATAFIALMTVARFTGSAYFCFVILGWSEALRAEPQDRIIKRGASP